MTLAAIVAMTPDRVIGADNQIPWYLPADLKYFKKVTLGHPVIMGRKCFESIGRPLPKRTNIVLSRNAFWMATGVARTSTKQEALAVAEEAAENDLAFVIGGAEIYKLFWEETQVLYLTEVEAEVEGDVYFPEIDLGEWKLRSREAHRADGKNEYDYTYFIYDRVHREHRVHRV